ncbi:HD-GYP domain-containing protein [Ureibacillus thermosphaericus]|uniref:HD-GYP domain-containing protein n=1 Tax=Ureibacillus thermosphaericus TaxID=51173 RepID=UPI0030C9B0CA
MKFTMVNVNNLELGAIIAKDIYANTRFPIITKNSPISHKHLHVIKAFNIHEVPILINSVKKSVQSKTGEVEEVIVITEQVKQINPFEKKYLETLKQFKKDFSNWEAGAKIDMTKVRGTIFPLVEQVLQDRSYIFDLNSYSNPNEYLYHHCIATGLIAASIANKLGFDKGNTLQMAIAGTLADCGMSKIPKSIRNKKAALTEAEFNEIRKHPIYSYNMVKELPALKAEMKIAIFQHHERLDGSGYPLGVNHEKVSQLAQIIAVADTFHAMTSERLYRSKESPFKVIEMIKEEEFGKFDIQVVNAMTNLVADLPIGTKVELSNLEKAEVMFINQYNPTRPLIKLLKNGEIIDLSKQRSLTISRVITNE